MKRALIVYVVVLSVLTYLLVSCGPRYKSPELQLADSYVRLVASFNILGDNLKQLCIDSVIDPQTCRKIGQIHDQVAEALDKAGYYLELTISLDDPAKVALCAPLVKPCSPDDIDCHEKNIDLCLSLLGKQYTQNIDIAKTGLAKLREYYIKANRKR